MDGSIRPRTAGREAVGSLSDSAMVHSSAYCRETGSSAVDATHAVQEKNVKIENRHDDGGEAYERES